MSSAPSTCAPVSTGIATLGYSLLGATLPPPSSPQIGAFISPLSVYYALALALNGAGPSSTTHTELLRLLTASPPATGGAAASPSFAEPELNTQLSNLHEKLVGGGSSSILGSIKGMFSSNSSDEAPATMLLANGIFTKSHVNAEYSKQMERLFKATTQTVTGAGPINEWVNATTKGEIPTLVEEGQPFDTVLANALYFKGTWKHKFSPEHTKARLFHAPSGDRRVMSMRAVFDKGSKVQVESVEGVYDAVALPYQGGQYSAVAVLPAPDVGLQDVLKSLADAPSNKVVRTPAKTIVVLPKFRAEAKMSLKENLKAMGVQAAFEPAADFSRISAGLYIDEVLHKTVVDVDEQGTVAAAATAVMMLRSMAMPGPTTELIFDRPFVFSIRHDPTSTFVFVGVVQTPPQAPDDAETA